MCIIAIKPLGVCLPSESTIDTMWFNNPDGAGFMYAKNGSVFIRKGFMTLASLKSALASLGDLMAIPLVLHFRIGTSGGNTPENTHPFPVDNRTKYLQARYLCTDLGVVHNGIIKSVTPRKTLSDTMVYTKDRLSLYKKLDPEFYMNDENLDMIQKEISSKMVFMDGDGNIRRTGRFETDTDGMVYSNDSYLPFDSRSLFYFPKWPEWETVKPYSNSGYFGDIIQSKTLYPAPDDGYILDYNSGDMLGIAQFYEEELWYDRYGTPYVVDYDEEFCDFLAFPVYGNMVICDTLGSPCKANDEEGYCFDISAYEYELVKEVK